MIRSAGTCLFLLVALALSGCATTPSRTQDVIGAYKLKGEGASGVSYQGAMTASASGPGLQIDWQDDPTMGRHGFGLVLDRVLGVVAADEGQYPGIVLYRVKDGHLEGIWRYVEGGSSGIGRENLEGPAGLEGEYKITLGANPGGKRYHGTVTMEKEGAIYKVDWHLPERAYVGTGVLLGDVFVVGYATDHRSSVAAYCIRRGGALEGITGRETDSTLGAEMLSRQDLNVAGDALAQMRKAPDCAP